MENKEGTQVGGFSEKGQKVYIEEKDFKGKNRLFVCSVEDGVIRKIKPSSEYFKHNKTGVIRKAYYIWSRPDLFYTSATSLDDAEVKFNNLFAKISKKLDDRALESEK